MQACNNEQSMWTSEVEFAHENFDSNTVMLMYCGLCLTNIGVLGVEDGMGGWGLNSPEYLFKSGNINMTKRVCNMCVNLHPCGYIIYAVPLCSHLTLPACRLL